MAATAATAAPKKLLPLDDAIAAVVETALALRESRAPETRTMSIWDASGFVLAADVTADRPMPPFRKSMMDGYAVRSADVVGDGVELTLSGEVAAGGEAGVLMPGQAVAIMTGAPLPEGADAIAIVENCEVIGGDAGQPDRVWVPGPVAAGANVTETGSYAKAGEVVVERGRIIESLTAGVLASFGAIEVEVYRRPRVTVIATGDELVSLERRPGPTQIRDSNRKTLMALAEAEWCRVVDGGIVEDDRTALKAAIRDGLEGDLLVLSGGVSAGSYDYVRECLEAEGVEVLFHKTAIKPGKPVLFGRTNRGLVFGLPGNPVSTFVTAVTLLTPAMRVLGRRPDHRPWILELPLVDQGLKETGKRTTFYPGDLVREGTALAVRPRKWRGSADHVSYSRANVLIRCEAGEPARRPGDRVRVMLTRSPVDW